MSTVILHELGHHLAARSCVNSKDALDLEHKAWEIAVSLAREYTLSFSAKVRRQGLYSYKWAQIQQQTIGSKRKQIRRPFPKSWRLATGRRSVYISVPVFYDAVGKKGRRLLKYDIKRATSKAERRKISLLNEH